MPTGRIGIFYISECIRLGFLLFQSKNLVTGGLDVLETIGKKTYDVLAEGDHGLKNTIKPNKPNLSAVSTLKLLPF